MKKLVNYLKSFLLNKNKVKYDNDKLELLTEDDKVNLCECFDLNQNTVLLKAKLNIESLEYMYRTMFLGRTDKINKRYWNTLTRLFYICNPSYKKSESTLKNYDDTIYNQILPKDENFSTYLLNVENFIINNY